MKTIFADPKATAAVESAAAATGIQLGMLAIGSGVNLRFDVESLREYAYCRMGDSSINFLKQSQANFDALVPATPPSEQLQPAETPEPAEANSHR